MHKKFEIYRTKIMGGCESGRKVVTHISKSDLPHLCMYFKKRSEKGWKSLLLYYISHIGVESFLKSHLNFYPDVTSD